MPNTSVPAAAIGLPDANRFFPALERTPNLSRRAALGGVAAASLGLCSPIVGSETTPSDLRASAGQSKNGSSGALKFEASGYNRPSQSGSVDTWAIPSENGGNYPDPIFAAINRHKVARRVVENFVGDEDTFGELCSAEMAVWREMVDVQPTTLAGLLAQVNAVLVYPDVIHGAAVEGPLQALQSVSNYFHNLSLTDEQKSAEAAHA